MPKESLVYRAFPSEVVSNTHDFEVRWVVHNDRRMHAVFARRRIASTECSLFVGTYPGYRKSTEEIRNKFTSYADRHFVDDQTAIRRTCAYNLSLERVDPGFRLDPTDEEGALLPEFSSSIVSYINESPPGFLPQAAFVYNRPRRRYEVWLLHEVGQDEEVFLYYGKYYLRDYSFNTTCDDHVFHVIPAYGTLVPDPRGVPAPLQVPGQGSRHQSIRE
jgi:hypothetical protein